jgi:hypothetical protein
VLNEATKRKSPNALSFGETQREFGDTAMVKPHLAITHTRELLGKSARAELVKIYGAKACFESVRLPILMLWFPGPHYFPYEIIPDEERGAVKIKESDRFLSPEVTFTSCSFAMPAYDNVMLQVLVAMVLTYAKSLAQAQTNEKVPKLILSLTCRNCSHALLFVYCSGC